MFVSLSLFYLTFLECGNCKHPYFIGEVSASFSVGTFTNIFNSVFLTKRLNSNTYKTYLQQIVAIEKKDITVKIGPVFILGNTDLLGSFSLNKKFLLSMAGSVRRQWTRFIFSYQSLCRQVDMLAFSYLVRVMIKTLRFPRILFVSMLVCCCSKNWLNRWLFLPLLLLSVFFLFLSLKGLSLIFLFIFRC